MKEASDFIDYTLIYHHEFAECVMLSKCSSLDGAYQPDSHQDMLGTISSCQHGYVNGHHDTCAVSSMLLQFLLKEVLHCDIE